MSCYLFISAWSIFVIHCSLPYNTNHAGHNAFLGFFYLDYAYNNAVVHVFIKILKESLEESLRTPTSIGSSDVETGPKKIATTSFPPRSMPNCLIHDFVLRYELIVICLLDKRPWVFEHIP